MDRQAITTSHLGKIKEWLGSGAINIFGLPFAGKDTHGYALSTLLDAPLLGSGEVFRNNRDLLTSEELETLDTGGLMPSATLLKLFTPYFSKSEFNDQPLILSSVGRWIGEEQGIMEAAEESDHPLKAVVYLHLDEGNVYKRLKASKEVGDRKDRPEDTEQYIEKRVLEFKEKTLPVIDCYRKLGILIEVDSNAEQAEVLKSILARLFVTASVND